jgi:hypothetical protein
MPADRPTLPSSPAAERGDTRHLSNVDVDALLAHSLKPDEISGEERELRVRELLRWFSRLTRQQANPKWLESHAYELAYYIATSPPAAVPSAGDEPRCAECGEPCEDAHRDEWGGWRNAYDVMVRVHKWCVEEWSRKQRAIAVGSVSPAPAAPAEATTRETGDTDDEDWGASGRNGNEWEPTDAPAPVPGTTLEEMIEVVRVSVDPDDKAAVYALKLLAARLSEADAGGCPCTLIEPCSRNCTCANGHMSGGCRRCAKYGSHEQRLAKARKLADADTARLAAEGGLRAAFIAGADWRSALPAFVPDSYVDRKLLAAHEYATRRAAGGRDQ